ncbi:MAG: hypothetical protein HN356_10230 [Calditrichaeota bacterium]|nr:hypothetical protein [Calditrichota bacterium]MBT7787896.1 hypothetical protein [Calditrichota bacterium]
MKKNENRKKFYLIIRNTNPVNSLPNWIREKIEKHKKNRSARALLAVNLKNNKDLRLIWLSLSESSVDEMFFRTH